LETASCRAFGWNRDLTAISTIDQRWPRTSTPPYFSDNTTPTSALDQADANAMYLVATARRLERGATYPVVLATLNAWLAAQLSVKIVLWAPFRSETGMPSEPTVRARISGAA
jgi:hypothetical protein